MNSKIQALIDDAVGAVVKFKKVRDSRAAHYWEGRVTALEQASQVRLTDAEIALIRYVLDENVSPPEGTDDLAILAQRVREERK